MSAILPAWNLTTIGILEAQALLLCPLHYDRPTVRRMAHGGRLTRLRR